MKDFYYILGTDSNCTAGEIKAAYRKLSKKFHPDLNEGDKYFEDRFREINEAYETLNNPEKRYKYDSGLKKSGSKREAYRNREPSKQTSDSPVQKSKSSGKVLTIVTAVILTVFGIYLIQSLNNLKKDIVKETPELSSIPLKIRKHSKPKHTIKTKPETKTFKRRVDSVPVKPIKAVLVVNKVNPDKKPDFLYTSDVRANLTGIINMRQSDDFNSAIIEKIPANAKVFVVEKGDPYYRVFYDNKMGYVPKWSLWTKLYFLSLFLILNFPKT